MLEYAAPILQQPPVPGVVVPIGSLEFSDADARLHVERADHRAARIGLAGIFGKKQ
jgi:hypothetical protein